MAQASGDSNGAAKNGGNYRKRVTVSTPIELSQPDQFDWRATTTPCPCSGKSQDQSPHHSQANHLEEDLMVFNIPYVIHKNSSFYELPEIQDLLAYLHIAKGENADIEQGFERVVKNLSINSQTYETIKNCAKSHEINLIDACIVNQQQESRRVDTTKVYPQYESKIHELDSSKM